MTPAYLVAYPFLDRFERAREVIAVREWTLDSGAWSVFNAGGTVDLARYTEDCLRVLEGPQPPREIYALDVIGDWQAGIANAERMRAAGVPAIPTYHRGDPPEALAACLSMSDKIALGGVAGKNSAQLRLAWAKDVMARVWPRRVHGFAFCSRMFVKALPFDSVDSTAFFLQPLRYHRFHQFGKAFLPRAGATRELMTAEIAVFLRLEQEARARWRTTMAPRGWEGPTLYLSFAGLDQSLLPLKEAR